jgi:hypothetical protein
LAETRANTFAEAYRAILQLYADSVGKPRWGEKTPHNLYYVGEILEDFPEAQFIHINRDGRDVAVEQLRSAFGPRNVYTAALIWRHAQREARAARAKVPQGQWLDLGYEGLVEKPAEVLAQVADFLGEAYEAAVLDFHRGETAQRRARTRDHKPLGSPVTAAFVGLYRRHLSSEEQGIFCHLAGAELLEAGYGDIAAAPPVDPEAAALFLELDARIRAATLDAPGGHIVYESYNDWLADQREERRRRGLWSGEAFARRGPGLGWDEEFLSGQRAPRRWKEAFAVQRRYWAKELVL